MSKLTDNEIQELLEQGNFQTDQNDDIKLYKKVFEILGKEPDFELSPRFADNIIDSISLKSDRSERIIFVLGAIGLFMSIVLALVFIGMFAKDTILPYLPHLAIGSVLLLLIQWLDKYSTRRQSFS
jgi:hypothetical protein